MRLYWSMDENVPLLGRRVQDGEVKVVPTSKFSDPRPATPLDLSLLKDVLEAQFGVGSYSDLLPKGEVVLLGSAPYLDAAYEVIADGEVLGHLFYDLWEFKWYFKPLEAGIARLQHRMEWISGFGLKGEVVAEAGEEDPKFVLLRGGGLAEKRGDKYVVVRTFDRLPDVEARSSSWSNVLSVNEGFVLSLESRALRRIWRLSAKFDRSIVSFSGGKDSRVLLELVRRSGIDHLVYFNDTGLELPETLSYVERVGVDIVGDAGDSFWKYVERFGPPARDYRWCCKVIKLAPTYRALRDLGPLLSFVGIRGMESSTRMRSGDIWTNKWLPGTVSASPIIRWSALAIWLYSEMRGITHNPLYGRGYERLGCYLCPASKLAHFERVKADYPDLWTRWEDLLRDEAARKGYGECWLRYGLWRWMRVPEAFSRLCRAPRRSRVRARMSKEEVEISPLDEESLLNMLPTLGEEKGSLDVRDGRLSVSGDPWRLIRLSVRATNCTGCGICAEYCERGAIRVDGRATVDPQRCVGCGVCNEVCPLYVYGNRLVDIA